MQTESVVWRVLGLSLLALLPACASDETSGDGHIWISEQSFTASFAENPEYWDSGPIARMDSSGGVCNVWPAVGGPPLRRSRLVRAGKLNVSGGNLPLALSPHHPGLAAPAVPDYDVVYEYVSETDIFVAGQTISVSGSGEVVPGFSMGGVVLPSPVKLAQPVLRDEWAFKDPSVSVALDRAADFEVTWTGGDSLGKVRVQLTDTSSVDVVCAFPTDTGRGVIPAALLGYLSPNLPPDEGRIHISTYASGPDITAGKWTIFTDVGVGEGVGNLTIQ